jgi:hypothetical protein
VSRLSGRAKERSGGGDTVRGGAPPRRDKTARRPVAGKDARSRVPYRRIDPSAARLRYDAGSGEVDPFVRSAGSLVIAPHLLLPACRRAALKHDRSTTTAADAIGLAA